MKKTVLMNAEEPSDKDLNLLMHEVATEAKAKAVKAQELMREKIRQQIAIASAKKW